MRTYIIEPYFYNGEQQGYLVQNKHTKWKASHSAIELCETHVLRLEQMLGATNNKPRIYGKDFQIIYNNCESEGISDARLALYR